MRMTLIVAMAQNRVIGAAGRLPWRLPADLRRFKALTMGYPLLMGRKTHESIGRPLPGRTNIVLTRTAGYSADGCFVVHSIDEALSRARPAKELFIIGGASLYANLLACADRIHLTLIHHDYSGDVEFPEFDVGNWTTSERQDVDAGPEFPHPYSFIVLDRSSGGIGNISGVGITGGLQ